MPRAHEQSRRLPPRQDAPPTEVRNVLDALRRIVQTLRTAGREGERRVGLTSAQLFALQRIADHPGASVNEIAARTFTHQSSVSVVIQRLVAQGLVAKVAATQDRRRQHLAITPAGRGLLRRAPAVVQDRLIDAVAALSTADRRTLARSLRHVAGYLASVDTGAYPPMLFEDGVMPIGGRMTKPGSIRRRARR